MNQKEIDKILKEVQGDGYTLDDVEDMLREAITKTEEAINKEWKKSLCKFFIKGKERRFEGKVIE
jgi:hypothetical protein